MVVLVLFYFVRKGVEASRVVTLSERALCGLTPPLVMSIARVERNWPPDRHVVYRVESARRVSGSYFIVLPRAVARLAELDRGNTVYFAIGRSAPPFPPEPALAYCRRVTVTRRRSTILGGTAIVRLANALGYRGERIGIAIAGPEGVWAGTARLRRIITIPPSEASAVCGGFRTCTMYTVLVVPVAGGSGVETAARLAASQARRLRALVVST